MAATKCNSEAAVKNAACSEATVPPFSGLRIYISGPITGKHDLNRSAFLSAWAALEAAGYKAINPLWNGLPVSADWCEHMRADIKLLMDCNAIVMLPEWEASRGAEIERQVAQAVGIRVFESVGEAVDARAAA